MRDNPWLSSWRQSGSKALSLSIALGRAFATTIRCMLNDVNRAIRYVRANAATLGVDPTRIGVLGFSAGGHLASTALTYFDSGNASSQDPVEKVSSRPDLGMLIYPVISMGPLGHGGSRENLLGKTPSTQLVDSLSSEKNVSLQTPPCFLVHAERTTLLFRLKTP